MVRVLFWWTPCLEGQHRTLKQPHWNTKQKVWMLAFIQFMPYI
jgi:hypothetical protein